MADPLSSEPYFILKDSNESTTKKFSVLASGYNTIKSKSDTIVKTIDGKLDISVGNIYEQHRYIVRVRKEGETRDGYGVFSDLDYFYSLNKPNGTPSNVITLTDHYGADHLVVMTGDFSPEALSVMLIGDTSWFIVPCMFQFLPE